MLNLEENSWIALKYGTLDKDTWQQEIKRGFDECWRVLDDYGVLIFKWSKTYDGRRTRDVSLENVLKVIAPHKPLFGHSSGSKLNTIWMCFMKIPDSSGGPTAELAPAGVKVAVITAPGQRNQIRKNE